MVLSIGIISFTTTLATLFLLLFPYYGILSKLIPVLFNELKKFDDKKIQKEISPFLDEKISVFFNDLVDQIPMGSMFLSGSLGDNIKGQAKKSLLGMVPELKVKGAEKAQQILCNELQSHWLSLLLKYGLILSLFSGALGALIAYLFVA